MTAKNMGGDSGREPGSGDSCPCEMVIELPKSWEREQRGELNSSSVVFILKGLKVAQRLVNKGVLAAGVRYQVEPYMNASPNIL
jgi:hypothetical protein